MAEEIADVVQKTSILLLDVEGTTTSISFVKDKLFPYAAAHARGFLEAGWEEAAVRDAVAALRKLSLADAEEKLEGVVAVPPEDAPKEEQIAALVDSVKWLMAADRKVGALKLLQGLIWKQGYDSGDLQGHVYEDVSAALERWRGAGERTIYVYSSGSTDAQRMLFARSTAGDLSRHLAGHFDTAVGGKQEPASYKSIAEKIGCAPEQILFLTDIVKEAEAAREAGVHAALVSREGNAPLPAGAPFPVLSSLAALQPGAAKRKQETQEEQPAKVAKATVEDDVKSSAVEKIESTEPAIGMEVDPAPTKEAEAKPEASIDVKKDERTASNEEIMIEEVTSNVDIKEKSPDSIIEIEPVVIDTAVEQTDDKTDDGVDKTEENKAKDENEPIKTEEEGSKNISEAATEKKDVTKSEKTPPVEDSRAVIEDITEKEIDEGMAESLDIDPIIEEPLDGVAVDDAEMEELQNVGDVLEKECDEILSKVNAVTNLESITVKPLLTPISEEATDADTTEPDTKTTTKAETEIESIPKTDTECASKVTETESSTNLTDTKSSINITEVESTTQVDDTDKSTKVIEPEVTPADETEKEKTQESPKVIAAEKLDVESSSAEVKEIPEQPTSNGDSKPTTGHVNGDSAANGVKLNGDSNGVERLTAANGEGRVNGSNGDSVEQKNGAAEGAAGVEEIKVKTVPAAAVPAEMPADA